MLGYPVGGRGRYRNRSQCDRHLSGHAPRHGARPSLANRVRSHPQVAAVSVWVAAPNHRAVAEPSGRGAGVREEGLPDTSADRGWLDEEEVQFTHIGATRRHEEIETEESRPVDGDECGRGFELLW